MSEGHDGNGTDHLSSQELAAHLDGTLAPDAARRVRAHLADCAECRMEASAVAGLLDEPPARGRWLWPGVAGLVAAGIAGILLLGPTLRGGSPTGDSLRAPGAAAQREAIAMIGVISPDTVAEAEPGIEFRWESLGEGALYRITLTDAGGDPVWTTETYETALALPSDVPLERGATYLWYVDAILEDARTATTGIRRLTVGP